MSISRDLLVHHYFLTPSPSHFLTSSLPHILTPSPSHSLTSSPLTASPDSGGCGSHSSSGTADCQQRHKAQTTGSSSHLYSVHCTSSLTHLSPFCLFSLPDSLPPLPPFLSLLSSLPLPTPLPPLQVFSALSQISKHCVDLAELVVEAEVFPSVLTSLRDPDEYVRKNTATLIREIAKHTPEVGRHDCHERLQRSTCMTVPLE